jgi:hypothetical protein
MELAVDHMDVAVENERLLVELFSPLGELRLHRGQRRQASGEDKQQPIPLHRRDLPISERIAASGIVSPAVIVHTGKS